MVTCSLLSFFLSLSYESNGGCEAETDEALPEKEAVAAVAVANRTYYKPFRGLAKLFLGRRFAFLISSALRRSKEGEERRDAFV